ncbi:hypothetical protein R1sor_004306 [Riccia sorocarpa]|uniref:Uncharacterized protein n=1 Tax=Riccia sorocarpa TaxID=122646 RepID=A0ABD3HK31_9MARC
MVETGPQSYPLYCESRRVDGCPSFRASFVCGFPIHHRDTEGLDGMLEAIVRGPALKFARAFGGFRHMLACSRPRIHGHKSPDVEERSMLSSAPRSPEKKAIQQVEMANTIEAKNMVTPEGMRMKLELQAVLRHLEVRWQLFNEAMTKWSDLEAMLAFCTDNVTWSGGSGIIISGKNSPLLSRDLRSLLERRLSLDVVIDRITRLSPMICPDMSVDKDGNYVSLQDRDLRSAAASLDVLLGMTDIYREDRYVRDAGPYMVLEKDHYKLRDMTGNVVEEGTRTVLWKQHNSTWYIRACMICPSGENSSAIEL